jgi:hypothetical protein
VTAEITLIGRGTTAMLATRPTPITKADQERPWPRRQTSAAQGIEVKDRGRVPAELVVKFKAATSQ